MAYNIKTLKPQETSKFHQGEFDRYNPKKYFGPRPIIYRSSYELSFMRKMEANNMVEKWSSENIVIPYTMQEKVGGRIVTKRHNYNTDFEVHLKNGKKIIVEVKPRCQCPESEAQMRRNPDIRKNAAKWAAAFEWARLNGYEFRIITERHLATKIF